MIEDWGEAPDGTRVQRVSIRNGGLSARFLTLGATLQDLRLSGVPYSLVLGYAELTPYLTNPNYFGSTIGRFANRINRGLAVIDGQALSLDLNENDKHHLHGGAMGSSFRIWRIKSYSEHCVEFEDTLPDGHMGYPGNLNVTARFELDDENTLISSIEATTDAPTLCNFTTHNYFNLDGSKDIRNHILQVNAENYLPVDEEGIPTGSVEKVDGSPFDYRSAGRLSRNTSCVHIDHNFCGFTQLIIAKLGSSISPLGIELSTSEPGLQVYTGDGIRSDRYKAFAGVALEPQKWPDAPNQQGFPSALLRPGQITNQTSRICVLC